MKIFDLNDFKKWIRTKDHEDKSLNIVKFYEGDIVSSKINLKKLYYRIKIDEENKKETVKNFHKYGGIVLKINENVLTIQTENKNIFKINQIYIKSD